MNIISLKELRLKVESAQNLLENLFEMLVDDNAVIIDIPAPEKKVRKKRVKKEKTVMLGPLHPSLPEKPKRGRRAKHAFVEPKLREGETPV
jgi:hypothetical protein